MKFPHGPDSRSNEVAQTILMVAIALGFLALLLLLP